VRGESSTFGSRGRSEKRLGSDVSFCGTGGVELAVEGVSVGRGGVEADRPTGVGTLEIVLGVFTAEGRGLFLERGRDEGTERKSSGMSFH
jgi:hypothetical protein